MNSRELFYPDGKSLHKVVVGQSGSGKSYFLEAVAGDFLKENKDPNWRLIYFSPKNEGFIELLPKKKKSEEVIGLVNSVEGMMESMRENFLTVFYPDTFGLDETMDETINALFDFKEVNPDFKATLVIDDAQVFLSARKESSESQRRLALLGRSRELNAVYVSHAVVLNKSLEAQVETLVFFSLPAKIHWKATDERYGFNPEPYIEELRSTPYSYVVVDVRTGNASMMNPILLE